MIKYKKFITALALVSLLIGQLGMPLTILAAPDLPNSPDTTEHTEQPESPSNSPSATPEPTAQPTIAPTPHPEDDQPPANTPTPTPVTQTPEAPNLPGDPPAGGDEGDTIYTDDDEVPEVLALNTTSDDNNTGNDTSIETGDSDAAGTVSNVGNNNLAVVSDGSPDVAIVNDSNGSGSTNDGSAIINDTSNLDQINNANLDNALAVDSNTGDNSASRNTGGDNTIETGDANATGTILNMVNTNVEALVISEFNVIDDHLGDLVLDYEANCIAGCDIFNANLANTNNGSDSTNTSDLTYNNTDTTNQINNADINNDLVLIANSGKNTADNNTGGDNTIETGDANASANVVNVTNTNIAGGVLYGVVNIFGDLTGDIIVPENYLAALGIDTSIYNKNNGSGSTNNGMVTISQEDFYNQFNNADIANNLNLSATTGDNATSQNTGGNNEIETGDVTIDAQVTNIANNNIIGDDLWLVIVNHAGNWFGQLFGFDGTFYGNIALAGPSQVTQAGDGTINVTNEGNGADSQNTGSVAITDTNKINQTNNANIANNITIDANTGKNSASRNTNGNNSISTGDANIMLNLINMANNNIIGGNMVVTVVNVFGNWFGNLFKGEKPVYAAEANSNTNALGGISDNHSSNTNNSNNNNTNTESNNNDNHLAIQPSSNNILGASSQVSLASNQFEESEEVAMNVGDIAKVAAAVENDKFKINLAWLIPISIMGLAGVFIKRKLI